MNDNERRIEKVAMYAANTDIEGDDFYKLIMEKIPGVTQEEIDRGFIRGINRLDAKVRAKFGMEPGPQIPEWPLDDDKDRR